VVIDGVIDTSTEDVMRGGIYLGERDTAYGRNLPGSLRNITVSNVIYNNAKGSAVRVNGYLQDSTITNVIAARTEDPAVSVLREGGMKNVMIGNIVHNEKTQAAEKM
jgi:hypothetical protein